MTFEQFYTNTIRSYYEDPNHQRLGQFFMNSLGDYNLELYHSVPECADCFYDDKRFGKFTDWLQDNWVDTLTTVTRGD
jgi:hypothetical protein